MTTTIDNILDNICILDWSKLSVLESLKKEIEKTIVEEQETFKFLEQQEMPELINIIEYKNKIMILTLMKDTVEKIINDGELNP